MEHRTLIHNTLLLIGGVSLGLVLRPSQPLAGSAECPYLITRAALVEVRRVEGDGALEVQQMAWHSSMQLTLPEAELTFSDATLPNRTFHVIAEDGP